MLFSQNLSTLVNITSLNLFYVALPHHVQFSQLTNLTSLCLDQKCGIKPKALDNMTKLFELKLINNDEIEGSTLRTLTSLRTLYVCGNTTITDSDIESLPIRSLSIGYNTRITSDVLPKLNLTSLDVRGNGRLTSDIIVQCTTLIDLQLHMIQLSALGLETMSKMTNLRKLTIDWGWERVRLSEDCVKHLTNITHLGLINLKENIKIPPLALQSLFVRGTYLIRLDLPIHSIIYSICQ